MEVIEFYFTQIGVFWKYPKKLPEFLNGNEWLRSKKEGRRCNADVI